MTRTGRMNEQLAFNVRRVESLVAHPPKFWLVHPLDPRHPLAPSVLGAGWALRCS